MTAPGHATVYTVAESGGDFTSIQAAHLGVNVLPLFVTTGSSSRTATS
jgi:hypothetical protein